MAVYERDYYGRSKYGGRQSIEMVVDPFEGRASGFDAVSLTWTAPAGDWGGFRLLHNTTGIPNNENDGEVLLDASSSASYLHSDLDGGWHYYAIFLYNNTYLEWERAAGTSALVPFDFGSADKMWDLIPEYYKDVRSDWLLPGDNTYRATPAVFLNNTDVEPNMQLARFLQVLGWGMDVLRSEADTVLDGYDIERVHVSRLALMAEQFGGEIEESASASQNRSLVRNLGWLYRKLGTLDGIREMLSLTTGWPVDVTLGPNLMLSEDQANFINPNPQEWDPYTQYYMEDRVKYGNHLFQAKIKSYGINQAPPLTRTSNTWWDVDAFVEPADDVSVARTDTGDISTWQIQGPDGWQSGGTHIGAGSIDPEDGSITWDNSLGFRNTQSATGDFTLRSIPRYATNLTSWDPMLVFKSGVPVPKARHEWVSGVTYQAGTMVLYQGAPYLSTTATTQPPSTTSDWKRLGYDDRIRLALSWYAHGPWNGTVGTGGLNEHAVITEFDENGGLIHDVVCNPASYANIFYDAFNNVQTGVLDSGRTGAVGTWGSGGSGTWAVRRDDDGGYVVPPSSGRSYQLAPASVADGNVGITYRDLPTAGRLIGLVFRWADASSFWVAAQNGVYKVTGGTRGAASTTYTPFVPGDRMRVNFNGSTIKVYKNGTQVGGTITDSMNSTANRHGVLVEA
jgi:phage tail-like protein